MTTDFRINNQIRATQLRVIGAEGENLGVLTLSEALDRAKAAGLDLIEVAADATPPVARIADYGKYFYELNKKEKAAKEGGRGKTSEIKSIQITIGTGDHDLLLKAKQASKFLKEGDRVKIDLFLGGRAKYLDEKFLKERLERILKLLTEEYKVAEPAKKSLKGMSLLIERAKKS